MTNPQTGIAEPRAAATAGRGRAQVILLWTSGVLAASVLLVSSRDQLYDSNFVATTTAVSILGGDRLYRDLFEIGLPLDGLTAAGAQLLSGGRIAGEFARHALLIVAGFVIACHLGLRTSRSVAAVGMMMTLALIVLAATPLYHSGKLFFFPLIVWLAWRYIERPDMWRSAALGASSAAAFLFRHDYGIYAGLAALGAFVLARCAMPSSRQPRSLNRDAAAGVLAVLVVLGPWAVLVQQREGLLDYARSRIELYPTPPPAYRALFDNPIRRLLPAPRPQARPGIVEWHWNADVDASRRAAFEREFGLRLLPRSAGPWRYEVDDVYDARFVRLLPFINTTAGIDWPRVREIAQRLPTRENAIAWVMQLGLFLVLALVMAALGGIWSGRRGGVTPIEAWQLLLAGLFLALVVSALLREPSYIVVVVPLGAALAARFLVSRLVAVRVTAFVLVALTFYAAWVWAKVAPVFAPTAYAESIAAVSAVLLASPPSPRTPEFAYLRECTAPDDRIFITGMTPLDVSFYTQRRPAGGHIYWRIGWRADAAREAQSLALLHEQSVPIAYSTSDPVWHDLRFYPHIRQYFEAHYVEVEGTRGRLLVDRRRSPVRRHDATGFPCFR